MTSGRKGRRGADDEALGQLLEHLDVFGDRHSTPLAAVASADAHKQGGGKLFYMALSPSVNVIRCSRQASGDAQDAATSIELNAKRPPGIDS